MTPDGRHGTSSFRHGDQTFSFTDCASFALMRSMGIDEAFTFDRTDFLAAGFIPLP